MPQDQLQQTIYPITSKPGIKRDGTQFDGDYYIDGQWVRWYEGRPRKILGYKVLSDQLNGPQRGINLYNYSNMTRVHSGYESGLEFIDILANGSVTGVQDRTPVGFVASASNIWQFDAIFDAGGTATMLIAHSAPNLDISNSTQRDVWYGDVITTSTLSSVGISVAGGVVVFHPYLFLLDNNGYVQWSDANTVTFSGGDSGSARIAEDKLVRGMSTRGGPGNSPAGLIWSLTSLIRVNYVGGTAIFSFDTISNQTSLLSTSAVIEYDGVHFWPGTDRFMFYNGVVRDLPNALDQDYFFSNLNYNYRQRVFAVKIPRWGEIWWFYPSGTSTECNRVLIFNVRENTWYDTACDRAVGAYAQVFPYPIMGDSRADATTGKYILWQHETGVDEDRSTVGGNVNAIQSYFETNDIAFAANGPMGEGWTGIEKNIQGVRLEPDFAMTGTITATVTTRAYAQSAATHTNQYTFSSTTEKIDLRDMGRLMRFRFESNVQGGNYNMGQPLLKLQTGQARPA